MGDLRNKRRTSCRNGVREYLVWLVAEAHLEWFCLEEDEYRPQLPDAQGLLHSRVFPGLQLPVAPLLAGDTAKVLAALTEPEPLNTKPPETSVKSEDTGSGSGCGIFPSLTTPTFLPVSTFRSRSSGPMLTVVAEQPGKLEVPLPLLLIVF